jgi:addiction module HigA family antidote
MINNIQDDAPHPGTILNELYLKPLMLSITQTAIYLKMGREQLSNIINGKAGISPLMALRLAQAFNTTAQYWLNLQNEYNLSIVYHQYKHEIDSIIKIVYDDSKEANL